jgi:uncharacterized protein (TIGR02594 family)
MNQPSWLAAAWAEFSVRETPGSASSSAVLSYYRDAGRSDVRDDAVPWCAAFLGAMLKRGGFAGTGSLLARSYLNWGDRIEAAKVGAVAVLTRGSDAGAGHVGFVVGAAGGKVFLLGGNQSDAVTVEAFDTARVLGYRWPDGEARGQTPDKENCDQGGDIVVRGLTPRANPPGDDANFEVSLRHVLEIEGGYSDDPYDPGGPTNRGITLAVFANWHGVTLDAHNRARLIDDLKRIADDTVAAIYRKRYWVPARCADLPGALALMHFDASVNHGVGAASRMLQQALSVSIDGEIGPETLGAAGRQNATAAVDRYADIRRARYRALPHFWRFGRGWLRRVDATRAAALALEAPITNPNLTAKGQSQMTAKDKTGDYKIPRPGEVPGQPMAGDVDTVTPGKWWGHSKTVWGTLITAAMTVLPVLGPLIGLNLPADVIQQLGEQALVAVQALGGLFGVVLALYGRTQASAPLVRRDVKVRV